MYLRNSPSLVIELMNRNYISIILGGWGEGGNPTFLIGEISPINEIKNSKIN
jgi:hypothetical protein